MAINISTRNSSISATKDLGLAVSAKNPSKTVFVELDQKPAKANVVREGFRVPSVIPDGKRLDEVLGGFAIQPPKESPRVVGQNIAAGTKVGKGTEVDLVLAPREDVPMKVFDDIHVAVAEQSVFEVFDLIKEDRAFQTLVLKYENADEVDDTDKVALSNLMEEKAGMAIDESVEGQRFKDGFNAMRVALAFK